MVLDVRTWAKEDVCAWLQRREGGGPATRVKTMSFGGLPVVFYADLESNIDPINAEQLAELAIKSVQTAGDLNGICYLADNIDRGIHTPLTNAYRDAILARTGAPNLQVAESILRSKDRTLQEPPQPRSLG